MMIIAVCNECQIALDLSSMGVLGEGVTIRGFNRSRCEICEESERPLHAVPLLSLVSRLARHRKKEIENEHQA